MQLDPLTSIREAPAALPWSRSVRYYRWGYAWVYLGRAVGTPTFAARRRSVAQGYPERWITLCVRGRYVSVGGDF